MATSIKWNFNVYVEEGPSLSSPGSLSPDGPIEPVNSVTSVNVTISKGGSTRVAVQPGPLEDFQFIFIKSDRYGDGTQLSYKYGDVEDGTGALGPIILEKDHILTSGELIKLLTKAPNFIEFTNNTDGVANIQIVVATNATVS